MPQEKPQYVGGTNAELNEIYQQLRESEQQVLSPMNEGVWNRTVRKFGENPFVPLGLALACVGVYQMFTTLKARDSRGFQNAQRMRVGAQLATTLALVGGMYFSHRRNAQKSGDPEKVSAASSGL